MKRPEINTRAGKRKFIRSLMRGIEKDLLSKVDRMPEDWDGIELRWLISDTAKDAQLVRPFDAMPRKRHKDYQNTVIINNL